MFYFSREPGFVLIECEKCKKVMKYEDRHFSIDSNFCTALSTIPCKCGNSVQSGVKIYSKDLNDINKKDNAVRCPKCGSKQIQLIQKRWSPLTGFLTNKVDRICMNCKSRF